jgi:hypothetical protein
MRKRPTVPVHADVPWRLVPWSTRVRNVFDWHSYGLPEDETVRSLAARLTAYDLLRSRNFGRHSSNEVRMMLSDLGLSLCDGCERDGRCDNCRLFFRTLGGHAHFCSNECAGKYARTLAEAMRAERAP